MADAQVGQLFVTSVGEGASSEVRTSQLAAVSVINYPSDGARVGQYQVNAVAENLTTILNSQLSVIAVVRGYVEDPKIWAWTFSLDGHDFYVLRLGDGETFVYDTYSEQWVDWISPNRNNWRLNTGINWHGGTSNEPTYGSNVIVGDDVYGLLYFLNPDQPYDDHPVEGEDPMYFERIVMGQYTVSGRTAVPCYVIHVTADPGDPAYTGAAVTLSTSDDSGNTFTSHGSIAVTAGQYGIPQLGWYSLGQITEPGRLFKIVDDGAVARIDNMDMNDDG